MCASYLAFIHRGPPVTFCVLRYNSLSAPPKGLNTTLEFPEGHLCRAGEAPRNRSLRRRDIIISFRFAGVKEDLNRGRNGSR